MARNTSDLRLPGGSTMTVYRLTGSDQAGACTQTLPLAIYISQSSGKTDEAIALSLVLVLVSLVVMIFRRQTSQSG